MGIVAKEKIADVPQSAPPARYKILIVDAVEDDRAYFRLLLKRRQDAVFEIHEADNARDGFKMCATLAHAVAAPGA